MITRIVFQDVSGLSEFCSDQFIISEQSAPLGEHTCYAIFPKEDGQSKRVIIHRSGAADSTQDHDEN